MRADPTGCQERRGGQGLPQISDPAEGPERITLRPAQPQGTSDACDRERRTRGGSTPKDPHRVANVHAGLARARPCRNFWAFNPAWAQMENKHVWHTAWAEIMKGGRTPEASAEKAFKRVEAIFAKYPISQA